MPLSEPIIEALNHANVRYVVVGGVAVILQGYVRLTVDLDLVIDLDPSEARKAIETLVEIGFRPTAPVKATDFADGETRRRWIDEKGMRVFPMHDPANSLRRVDLFVEHPIDFEELWAKSEVVEAQGVSIRIASIPHLIDMKRQAGRPQDLVDIEALDAIQRRRTADGR